MRIDTFLFDKQDRVWLNPQRKYVNSCVVVPDTAYASVTTAAKVGTTPGQSAPIIFEGAQNSVTELEATVGEHLSTDNSDVQARLSVLLDDIAYRRQLMNRDILSQHVFGNQLRPIPLKETILLESQQNIRAYFLNNSTAGISHFRPSFRALKVEASEVTKELCTQIANQARIRKSFLHPFWFTTDAPVSVPLSSTKTAFLTNTRDKDLVAFYVMMSVITTGVAGDTQEKVSFEIYDAGTQRPWQNQPVTMNCGAGVGSTFGNLPYVLPQPGVIPANQQLRVDFTNLLTDAAVEVFFTLFCIARYTGEPLWNQQDVQQMVPVLSQSVGR